MAFGRRLLLHLRHSRHPWRSACAFRGRPVIFRLFGRPGAGFSKSIPDMKTISAKPDSVRRDWYLVNAEGKINRFVNIFVNDEDIRFIDEKATAVQDTDEISIVPAIAGG